MPGEVETEKPQGEAATDTEKVESQAAKSVVGIIYPPPEVRSILQRFYNSYFIKFGIAN